MCSKAPAQHQFSSQNLMEIVHYFIALGEVCRDLGRLSPLPSAGMEAEPASFD